MGGDYYPPILIYGISVTWDEIVSFFGQLEDIRFEEQMEHYDALITKKYNLHLYNYMGQAYSRMEGRDHEAENYFYAIGYDINAVNNEDGTMKDFSSTKLATIEKDLKPRFDKLVEDFPDHSVIYILGVID